MHALAIAQHLARAAADHMIHIGDGDGALSGVRGDNHLDVVRRGGCKSQQLCLVGNVRVYRQHHCLWRVYWKFCSVLKMLTKIQVTEWGKRAHLFQSKVNDEKCDLTREQHLTFLATTTDVIIVAKDLHQLGDIAHSTHKDQYRTTGPRNASGYSMRYVQLVFN